MSTEPSSDDEKRALRRLLREAVRTHERFIAIVKIALRISQLPQHEPPPGLDTLTSTELAIIHRIVHTDDKFLAIYVDMKISKRRFHDHLNSIYTKLGVRKRSGLVRVVLLYAVLAKMGR